MLKKHIGALTKEAKQIIIIRLKQGPTQNSQQFPQAGLLFPCILQPRISSDGASPNHLTPSKKSQVPRFLNCSVISQHLQLFKQLFMTLTLNAVFQPFFPKSAFPALVFFQKEASGNSSCAGLASKCSFPLKPCLWPKHSVLIIFEWHHLINTSVMLTAYNNCAITAPHGPLAQPQKWNSSQKCEIIFMHMYINLLKVKVKLLFKLRAENRWQVQHWAPDRALEAQLQLLINNGLGSSFHPSLHIENSPSYISSGSHQSFFLLFPGPTEGLFSFRTDIPCCAFPGFRLFLIFIFSCYGIRE